MREICKEEKGGDCIRFLSVDQWREEVLMEVDW
jgi:hypothetical protein